MDFLFFFFSLLSQIVWIPVKSFIRFVFNVHSETRAFPFDESSFAFMARFITSRLQARYDCYSSGFISLRFACHDRKTRPLNVTRVSLWQDRIKESAKHKRSLIHFKDISQLKQLICIDCEYISEVRSVNVRYIA